MEYRIRKAKESEKLQIARTIAHSFEDDFFSLTKDTDRVAKVFENGLDANRFLVAEQADKIIGIICCENCTDRVLRMSRINCIRHFGFIRGYIAFKVFAEEFMEPLAYPPTTGRIAIVGVLEEARGQGVAKAMLKEIIAHNPQYSEFILDVTDINATAIKLYEKFGFVEYDRIPYKWAKQAGFNAKIWMKYVR